MWQHVTVFKSPLENVQKNEMTFNWDFFPVSPLGKSLAIEVKVQRFRISSELGLCSVSSEQSSAILGLVADA